VHAAKGSKEEEWEVLPVDDEEKCFPRLSCSTFKAVLLIFRQTISLCIGEHA